MHGSARSRRFHYYLPPRRREEHVIFPRCRRSSRSRSAASAGRDESHRFFEERRRRADGGRRRSDDNRSNLHGRNRRRARHTGSVENARRNAPEKTGREIAGERFARPDNTAASGPRDRRYQSGFGRRRRRNNKRIAPGTRGTCAADTRDPLSGRRWNVRVFLARPSVRQFNARSPVVMFFGVSRQIARASFEKKKTPRL